MQRGPCGHGVFMTQLKRTLTTFAKKEREARMQRISLRSSKERTAAPNFQKHIVVFEEAKQYQEKKLNFYFLKSKGIPFILSLIFFSDLDLHKVSALRRGVSSKGEFLLFVCISIPTYAKYSL